MTYNIVHSLTELPKFDPSKPTFCDIETDSLYGNLRTIQMYQPENDSTPVYVLDIAPLGYDSTQHIVNTQLIKKLILSLHTVWWGGAYDLGTLNISPDNFDDLQFAYRTAYPEHQTGKLKEAVKKLSYTKGLYKDVDDVKETRKGFKLGKYLPQDAYIYASTDVYALALMWEDTKMQNVIANNMAYKVDIISQRHALKYQQNGLLVNHSLREKFLAESVTEVEKLKKEFPIGFNPNSYLQVRKFLDTNESDNEALVKYALSDRPKAYFAKYIIDYKRALKEVSYLKSINHERMYTKFNVAGAVTGRFSSAGGDLDDAFNAQQIPKKFQLIFKQDTEDTCIVHLDYSTLELRLACAIYNEPAMHKQLMDGEDLHTSMAIMASGKKLHPDGLLGSEYVVQSDKLSAMGGEFVTVMDRTTAKSINFGYVFGMSAASYQNYAYINYGVSVTLEDAKRMRDRYFKKYPNFKKYHDNVWNNYKKPGFYYETALGRRVKPKLGTDGINGPVQGTGAETTKLAVHYLIKEYPESVHLIENVVHDAIYLRVAIADKQLWKERLAWAMKKGWTEILKCPIMKFKDIPMPIGA